MRNTDSAVIGSLSEIIRSVSDTPEGPYKLANVVLPRRGREYFDGMNTHNTCIKEYNGKFYLYYMGTTYGVTGEWGSGFYAESDDCIDFKIGENPKVYSRTLKWDDGRVTVQGNLERPSLIFDENGEPTHIFCASGNARHTIQLQG